MSDQTAHHQISVFFYTLAVYKNRVFQEIQITLSLQWVPFVFWVAFLFETVATTETAVWQVTDNDVDVFFFDLKR